MPEEEPNHQPPLGRLPPEDGIEALLGDGSFEEQISALAGEVSRAVNGGPTGRRASASAAEPAPSAVDMPQLDKVLHEAQASGIDLLGDVNLEVKVELGRSRMLVDDVLKLVEGNVVELDKLAGDPVEIFVNERLVARGEVLVLNDNFCVRVNEIVPGSREEDL